MKSDQRWLDWAMEIQAIAQTGLEYSTGVFDQERYTRLREISAEILKEYTDMPMEKIGDLFCNEEGFQTPKLDTRAAVIKGAKILLVQESNGRWSMPGGWADVGLTVRENVLKELKEEAGIDGVAHRIIAIHERDKRNHPRLAWSIWKVFVLCEATGGNFEPNSETIASGFFSLAELPPLDEGKTTVEQVDMCLRAAADPQWEVMFD